MNIKKEKYSKLIKKFSKNTELLSVTISVFLFVIIFILSPLFYNLDKSIQNSYYSLKNYFSNIKVSENILIVEIDERTLKKLGRFPFDRTKYIPIIENLNNAGASIIGFDIIFADKTSIDTNSVTGEQIDNKKDLLFADSIKKAKNIVLGGGILEGNIVEKSLTIFMEGSVGFGYFQPIVNGKNNTVYSLNPFGDYKNGEYDHFAIKLYKEFIKKTWEKENIETYSNQLNYTIDGIKIPYSNVGKKDILINFVKKGDIKNTKSYISESGFQKISFYDIYNPDAFEESKKYINYKDKIVIVGATAKGIKDIFNTPNGIEYGVYTHAHILNTIFTERFLSYFDKKLEFVLIFCLILTSIYLNLSRHGYVLVFSNLLIILLFLILLPILIVISTSLIMNHPSLLLFALIISLSTSNTVKYLIENKDKRILNKAFSEYVSKDIVEEILSGEGKINLDGEKKKVSVFFSDIEGFTTISEKFTPEKLVLFLKEYLGIMSSNIIDNRGYIDKYEGDAIMAIWGAFGKSGKESYNACLASVKQQKALKILNLKFKKTLGQTIKVRMGLNTGEAVLGNIGATGKKLEYTALGDSVNLASRLEGVNKFYGTYICASEHIYAENKEDFEFRFLDKIRVKGKLNGIKIYELINEKGKITKLKIEKNQKYEKALNLYFNKQFKEALLIFKLLEKTDPPSKVFTKRCSAFIENPPQEDWDGIWTMDEK